MTNSDFIPLIIAMVGGMFGLLGIVVQVRAQVRIASLTVRVSDAEGAHSTLQKQVTSDAERSTQIIKQWQDNYDSLLKSNIEMSTKYGMLSKSHDEDRLKLESVNLLSERQKAQIEGLQKQQDKNVESLKTAGDTIVELTTARNTDHRNFEDQISTANDLHIRERRELQEQIDRLNTELKSANEKIDKLTRRMAELDSDNQNLGFEVNSLRREIDTVKGERDQAIIERDEARKELNELKSKHDPIAAAVEIATALLPPPQ